MLDRVTITARPPRDFWRKQHNGSSPITNVVHPRINDHGGENSGGASSPYSRRGKDSPPPGGGGGGGGGGGATGGGPNAREEGGSSPPHHLEAASSPRSCSGKAVHVVGKRVATPHSMDGIHPLSIPHLGKKVLQKAIYGNVMLYTHPETKQRVVTKELANSNKVAEQMDITHGLAQRLIRGDDGENPIMEIGVQDFLRDVNRNGSFCPYVIDMIGYWQDARQTIIALPFCAGGGVFEAVVDVGGFSQSDTRRYMHQLMSGCHFLHRHNVAHRDISLENVMFADAEREVMQIIDFGVACPVRDIEGNVKWYKENRVGKVPYRPPEMFNRLCAKRVSQLKPCYRADRVDIFACGVFMYYMLTASALWQKAQLPDKIYAFIRAQGLASLFKVPQYARFAALVPKEAVALISGLIEFDEEKRLGLEQAMATPWFLEK